MGRQVSPAFFEGLGFVIACAELYRSQRGWLNPTANGLGDYPRLLSQEYSPGDIGFDPLGLKPKDADEFAEMATKELQHGASRCSRSPASSRRSSSTAARSSRR